MQLPLCDTTWGERRGSDSRHPRPQRGALPTELRPPYTRLIYKTRLAVRLCQLHKNRLLYESMAPRTGLEPVTYYLEGSCCFPSELSGHMEQKVRVELTNKGFAVLHSADEYLPHITRLGDYNGEWTQDLLCRLTPL